jgi:hypothetical protein
MSLAHLQDRQFDQNRISLFQCLKQHCGGANFWDTALQTERLRVWFPVVSLDFFYWRNPASRTVVLSSTQTLTRNKSSGDNSGRSIELTNLPRLWADCFEIWEPVPSGTVWSCNRPVQVFINFIYLEISHDSFQFHLTLTHKSPLSVLIRDKSSFYSR